MDSNFAFQYRPDFPDSIKDYAVFVDLAPKFSLKAEEILQRHIHLVIFSLKEVSPNWNLDLRNSS